MTSDLEDTIEAEAACTSDKTPLDTLSATMSGEVLMLERFDDLSRMVVIPGEEERPMELLSSGTIRSPLVRCISAPLS